MQQRHVGPCEHLSIGELSSRHGVSLRTLRFYEEKGLLDPIRVGNRRLYSASDDVKVKLVRIGAKFGFSLSEIKRMADDFRVRNQVEPERITQLLEPDAIRAAIRQLERRSAQITVAIEELKGSSLGRAIDPRLGRQPSFDGVDPCLASAAS